MMRLLLLVVLLYQILVGAVTYELKRGWNLVGTNEEINCSTLPSGVAAIYTYSGGTWFAQPAASNIAPLQTIAPYSGFWVYANADGNITFSSVATEVRYKDFVEGWNLVSGDLPLQEIFSDASFVIAWSYANGTWSFATSDPNLESIALQAGYEPLSVDAMQKRGIWIFTRRPTAVSLEVFQNYFTGTTIDPLYTGINQKVVIVSDNYPTNSYGYFLKNGTTVAADDRTVEPTDVLSFVPSNQTRLNFLNLDDIVVEYMPLHSGTATDVNESMHFSIVMPKLGGYEVWVDGVQIENGRVLLRSIGRHPVEIALLDREGNRIKNLFLYAEADENMSQRLENLNMSTGSEGVAHNSYFVPTLTNELKRVNFYFFDAYGNRYTIPVDFVVSSTQVDLAQEEIEVAYAQESKIIAGRLVDGATQRPLANMPVSIKAFPLQFGTLEAFNVVTDENGYFQFHYQAPQVLPSQDYNLTLYNDFFEVTLRLTFKQSQQQDENITIVSPRERYYITEGGEQIPIELYVAKSENDLLVPYPNLSISVAFEGNAVGNFDKVEGKSDASGKITFVYTAPQIIDSLQSTKLVFFRSDDPTVRKEVELFFLQNGIENAAQLSVSPDQIVVNVPQQSFTIRAEVRDSDGRAIKNVAVELVGALVNDGLNFGTVNQRSTVTDENGVATFIYTAPQDLNTLVGRELNLSVVVSETNLTQNVSFLFTTPQEARVAQIVADPHELAIDSGTFVQNVVVYTFDQNGRPVSTNLWIGSLVSPDDNRTLLGNVSPTLITTDENGRGTFTYTAPSSIEKLTGKSYELHIVSEQNSSVQTSVTLSFLPKANVVQKILLLPAQISVVDGMNQDIRILTLDGNNYPVSTTVRISFPLTDNVVLGTFDAYEVQTDQNGEGVVRYRAPLGVDVPDGEYNVTFSVENSTVSEALTLKFATTNVVADYMLDVAVPSSLRVEGNGNIVVRIVKKGDENVQIDDMYVKAVKVSNRNGLFTFQESGGYLYEYNESAIQSIPIEAQRVAGIDIVDIEAKIFDGEKDVNITASVPLTIISGPVSAISMVYKSVAYNAPFFEEHYVLHAVDKYGNPARQGTKITVGVVSGVRKDKNGNPIVVFDKNATLTASTLFPSKSELNISASNPLDLSTVRGFGTQEGQDTVVILGNEERYSPLYLGGWYVYKVGEDNKTLILEQEYDINETAFVDKLNFVVGEEKRYNKCEMAYNVIDFDEPTKEYYLDAQGNAEVVLRYDPFFVGHDIFFYANAVNDENQRVGISNRRKLWGTGLDSTSFTCQAGADAAQTCSGSVHFTLKDANAPLKDKDFTLANFKFEDISNDVRCSVSSVFLAKSNTDCDGSVTIWITVNRGSGCRVSWNGSLNYEY